MWDKKIFTFSCSSCSKEWIEWRPARYKGLTEGLCDGCKEPSRKKLKVSKGSNQCLNCFFYSPSSNLASKDIWGKCEKGYSNDHDDLYAAQVFESGYITSDSICDEWVSKEDLDG